MKVLYLLHSTEMHGATISFLTMIRGLLDKGVKPYLLIPNGNNSFERTLLDLKIDYQVVPFAESFFPKPKENKLLFCIKYFKPFLKLLYRKVVSFCAIYKVTKREKPDVIHTNVGVIHEGFLVARLMRIPHVWHLREFQDKDFNWLIFPSKSFFQWELRHSYVITISKAICSHFGLTDNVQNIYNGILYSHETSLLLPKKKYFMCASRVHPSKGHKDVITAFSLFNKEFNDYNLLILGDGNPTYIQELKDYSRFLNCDEKIIWLGFQKDVKKYMNEATALIVASVYEGFGRMTAEASFCGSIAIGRNTGGTREIINETGGELFTNPQELCDCMISIARLSTLEYEKRVLLAQDKAKELFSIESNVEKVFNMYESII